MKKVLMHSPSTDDFIHLLGAWRVWIGGAFAGAVIAALFFYFSPPSYRATATVLVDQNAEQVVPEERSDLVIYTFLQRETDKLVEIAWSDQVLSQVSEESGTPISDLRNRVLHLSQPSDAGWHFNAEAKDPDSASALASEWAGAFVDIVQTHPAGVNSLLEINYTQSQDLPVQRNASLGITVFAGALIGSVLLALVILFFSNKTK